MATTDMTTAAHVQVEPGAPATDVYDARRADLSPQGLRTWTPGRVTLRRDRLSCIASRTGPVGTSFDIDLADIRSVTLAGKTLQQRVVTIRTSDRVIHLRLRGPASVAKRVAIAREAAQHRQARRGPARGHLSARGA